MRFTYEWINDEADVIERNRTISLINMLVY